MLFWSVFDDFHAHPSQSHNHQSVELRQFVHQFRYVSSFSHSRSVGKCHQVGHALFVCTAFARRYNFHHILSSQWVELYAFSFAVNVRYVELQFVVVVHHA